MNENERKCPECDKTLKYSSKGSCRTAEKRKSICRECADKKHSLRMQGEENPFYKKTHNKKTRQIISSKNKKAWENKTPEELKEFGQKKSQPKEKNGMYGKTPYDIWLEKYGKEEADKRYSSWRESKIRTALRGEANPSFGRPPPHGTGNGWKSRYKGFYCRSLRELTFLISLDEQNVVWRGAENIRIKYLLNSEIKTYAPDFLVGNTIYEIKPIKLHNSKIVQAKASGAIDYCNNNNLEYKLIDVTINFLKIKEQYEIGNVIFDKRYEEKFLNYLP